MNFRINLLPALFILLCTFQPSLAQRVVKEFYNDEGKLCDSLMAAGYQVVTYDKNEFPIGQVTYYDIKGNKRWEGYYHKYDRLDIENEFSNEYQGMCTWYYENGRKSEVAYYDKGVLNGTMSGWYENGSKRYVMNFKNGTINGLFIRWYENGLLQHYGIFKDGKIVEN